MWTIARYTIVEYMRKKMLYSILGLGAVLMLGTVIAGGLALNEHARVIRDFSLWLIEIFGIALVAFFASNVLHQETNNNTIFLLLSKNIHRKNIILGKFRGFSGIILLYSIIMWLLYFWIAALYHVPLSTMHLMALGGIIIKLEVLLALGLFFSSFVSPFIALLTPIAIYFLAHTLGFVVYYTTVLKKDSMSPLLWLMAKIRYYVLPNFTSLSVSQFFDTPFILHSMGQAFGFAGLFHIGYIAIILFFTVQIYRKKSF